eukprot:NODE_5173_length_596_cov_55.219378_g4474_i0.p1 GENE.NODE_5173_length_596_cov_55.219378_g4474_i0~~NODE_5173_length_596_cov_55.219378_g4474_i0.p1  ORF type:complete len:104 (+),score=16.09 NODE_5173_length_596_cov_55.219378_g4474_i0:47-358(+)
MEFPCSLKLIFSIFCFFDFFSFMLAAIMAYESAFMFFDWLEETEIDEFVLEQLLYSVLIFVASVIALALCYKRIRIAFICFCCRYNPEIAANLVMTMKICNFF